METKEVLANIEGEREFQRKLWAPINADDIDWSRHTVKRWRQFMTARLTNALVGEVSDHEVLTDIRKTVAMGIACLEQHGCPPRLHEPSGGRLQPQGEVGNDAALKPSAS